MESVNILRLYCSVLTSILSDWIVDFDLCRLDTAVCSNKFRAGFLNVLPLCRVEGDDGRDFGQLHRFEWILLRGLHLKVFKHDSIFVNAKKSMLSRVKYLDVLESRDGLEVIEICPEVRELRLSCSGTDLLSALKLVKNLQRLDIYGCYDLSSEIGEAIVDCAPNLKTLKSPDEFDASFIIENCKELVSVEVGFNKAVLSAILSSDCLQCVSLIDGESNPCDQEDLGLIASCSKLVSFTSRHCGIDESALINLVQNCVRLTHIAVAGDISDNTLIAIGKHCRALTSLDLVSNNATIQGISCIVENCRSLSSLIFECSLVSGRSILPILRPYCKNLTSLSVNAVDLNDEPVRWFEECPSLINLYLYNSQGLLHCDVAASISGMEYIEGSHEGVIMSKSWTASSKQTIHSCDDFGRAAWTTALKQCPRLVVISFRNLKCISNSIIETLVGYCPLITSVSILNCRGVTETCLAGIGKLKIVKLELSMFFRLTDAILTSMILNKSKLRTIGLQYCQGYTDTALRAIATSCPVLSVFDIAHHVAITKPSITCMGLCHLVRKCRLLSSIDVTGIPGVDGELLRTIAAERKKMTVIRVWQCEKLRPADIDKFLSDFGTENITAFDK